MPLVECKEAFEYIIQNFSVITANVRRVHYWVLDEDGSAAVTDGFNRDIDELYEYMDIS